MAHSPCTCPDRMHTRVESCHTLDQTRPSYMGNPATFASKIRLLQPKSQPQSIVPETNNIGTSDVACLSSSSRVLLRLPRATPLLANRLGTRVVDRKDGDFLSSKGGQFSQVDGRNDDCRLRDRSAREGEGKERFVSTYL